MNCRRLIASLIGMVYLLTTQLVVHAVTMHDMSEMMTMDHDMMSYHSHYDDHRSYHTQEDLGISTPATHHDSTSCITIAKTVSKITTVTQYTTPKTLLAPVQMISHHSDQHSLVHTTTTADIQPPGRSAFLDTHYGHAVVLHC